MLCYTNSEVIKIRVHELAKKYNKTNKEFLDLIGNIGISGKSHLSSLEDWEIKNIELGFQNGEWHSHLVEIEIEKFKGIEKIKFKLSDINLLIGANNSGKSSILQATHFGISCLQTFDMFSTDLAKEKNRFSNGSSSTTVTYDELVYRPIDNIKRLGHKGFINRKDRAITISYTDNFKNKSTIRVETGRSRGNSLGIKPSGNWDFYKLLSSSDSYSYYVTGLSGIQPSEELRAAAIVKELAVKGSSNIVFRNILNLLNQDKIKWDEFCIYLDKIFPNTRIVINYDEKQHKEILVDIEKNGFNFPIDSMGTSFLQVVQILSYMILYSPNLIILDEPDAHLHPNNQKKIIDILLEMRKEKNFQLIISTHSKHIIEHVSPIAKIIWVDNGNLVEHEDNEKEWIGLMSEIGSLEKGALLNNKEIKYCILTEDSDTTFLKVLLESNEFNLKEVDIWSYRSCTKRDHAFAVTSFLRERFHDIKIILHVDRDLRTEEGVEKLKKEIESIPNISLFLTDRNDIEAYFVNSNHINTIYPSISAELTESLISECLEEMEDKNKEYMINMRTQHALKTGEKNHGKISINAIKDYENNPLIYTKGKDLLTKVCGKLKQYTKGNPNLIKPSSCLKIETLIKIKEQV